VCVDITSLRTRFFCIPIVIFKILDENLTNSYTKVILPCMKTAISLSDDLFLLADNFAKTQGMSRSELFATAVHEYIRTHSRTDLTERINAACAMVETRLPPDLARATRQKLLAVEW
jgi:hypothetical protein